MAKLTVQEVEHILKTYRGNGGRRSLYSLCKEHGITFEEGYVILASVPEEILKRVAQGKKIFAYSPVAQG